jgi:hypothetical protein
VTASVEPGETVIKSPAACYPGVVVLPAEFTPAALDTWQRAWDDALAYAVQAGPQAEIHELERRVLPGLLACVKRWDLGGAWPQAVAASSFPATPRADVTALVQTVSAAIHARLAEIARQN